MSIITDLHRTVSDQLNAYPDHKFSHLINDLKQQLKDPSLSPDLKREVAERIAIIESKGRDKRSNENLQLLVLGVYELGLSCIFGPIGAGIGTLTTSHQRRSIQVNRDFKVQKARKIGGRRVAQKKRRASRSPNKIDNTSIRDGAFSYILAIGWAVTVTPAVCLAGRVWSSLGR